VSQLLERVIIDHQFTVLYQYDINLRTLIERPEFGCRHIIGRTDQNRPVYCEKKKEEHKE